VDNPGERELAEILGQARSMAEAVRGAFRPVPDVAEASDVTGAVTVTVASHGARVTRVLVAADWKDRLGTGQLGMAVMQAVLSVQLGPVKDFFTGLTSAIPPAAPVTRPRPGSARPLPGPAAVAELAAKLSWDDLGDMLETVQKALDTVAAVDSRAVAGPGQTAGSAAAADERTVTGRSANRRVEVGLRGGQLASVTIDEAWAAKAGRQQLSDSLREAFEAAYDAVPHGGQTSHAGLAADLQSIVSRLGVPFPPPLGKDGSR
jgi:DNA-binding protein YbaB